MKETWRVLGALAAHRIATVGLVGLAMFLLCATPTLIQRQAPVPEVHDEFAYLLAGETFAKLRATNPTHPMWESLETIHVVQRPTYQAKYPPAQGLFLALGTLVSGEPILGVWISAALMVAAVCWMLQGWMPPRWALLGAVLVALQVVLSGRPYPGGHFAYWSQSYWGGAAAALGGALLYGALRRIIDRPSPGSSIVLAIGILILANSRPFEGLVISLPAAVLLAGWFLTRSATDTVAIVRRVVLPTALMLATGLGAMAHYNHRVTGDPAVIPYALYRAQYQVSPIFVWQDLGPEPEYLNEPMRRYHTQWEVDKSRRDPSPGGLALDAIWIAIRVAKFQLGVLIAASTLLILPWILRSRWSAFAVGVCGIQLIGAATSTFYFEHYVAPMTAVAMLVACQGLRRWSQATIRGYPTGRALVLLLIAGSAALTAGGWAKEFRAEDRPPYRWATERAEITDRLTADGGRHLILVRYGPNHDVGAERVYNGADIDAQPVVWARDLTPAQNEKLLGYFEDRTVWLLTADHATDPSLLHPYPLPD